MDSKPILLGLGVLCLASASPQAQLVNGDFELPQLASGANYFVPVTELGPWQTTDQSFEIWASALPGEGSPGGRQHLEILSQSTTATVSQTIVTIPGEDYVFAFSHSPRPGVDSAMSVAMNGQPVATFNETGAVLTAFRWGRFRTNFTATTAAMTISFTDTAGTAAGTHIDNVVFERLPVAANIRVSQVEVRWESVVTKAYQVQSRSTVTTNVWTDLGAQIQGNGGTLRLFDTVPEGEPQRVYRVNATP